MTCDDDISSESTVWAQCYGEAEDPVLFAVYNCSITSKNLATGPTLPPEELSERALSHKVQALGKHMWWPFLPDHWFRVKPISELLYLGWRAISWLISICKYNAKLRIFARSMMMFRRMTVLLTSASLQWEWGWGVWHLWCRSVGETISFCLAT